jgi:hypothetical protein
MEMGGNKIQNCYGEMFDFADPVAIANRKRLKK